MAWLPTLDRSWFRSRLVLVAILLLLLVAASLVGDRGLLRLYQLHRTRAALTREIEQVSAASLGKSSKSARSTRRWRKRSGRFAPIRAGSRRSPGKSWDWSSRERPSMSSGPPRLPSLPPTPG